MQSFIIKNTNSLLKTCSIVCKNNNLKVVPVPVTNFKNLDNLCDYNAKLNNLIKNPELFFLNKKKIEKKNKIKFVNNYPIPTIPDKYFKF